MTTPRRSAVAVCLVCASALAADGTPESPREVFRIYTDAMAAGDAVEARKWVVADDHRLRLVTARPAAMASEKAFRDAVNAAFPGQLKDIGYGKSSPINEDDSPTAPRVIYDKDTATMVLRESPETVRFRRVNGQWKVDLNAMFSPATVDQTERFREALIEVMNALAAEVKAGRFKTFEEVQADLATRVKMRLATPDQPATTRPAF